jgi:hypothetical protein
MDVPTTTNADPGPVDLDLEQGGHGEGEEPRFLE